jgi:hypothetical protein
LKIKITLTKWKTNQDNEGQIRKKKYNINSNWMMKLKTNKTFLKITKKKNKNQKNNNRIEKNNTLQIVILNWKQTKLLWKGHE